MTGEEKRQQLKAQYKADLQKRKEFLEQAKHLRHSRKMNEAITDLTGALDDDTDEWIEKLNQESVMSEARMEMALDEASSTQQELEKLAKQAEAEKFNAENLLREMKQDMGLLSEEDMVLDPEKEKKKKDEDKDEPPRRLGDF